MTKKKSRYIFAIVTIMVFLVALFLVYRSILGIKIQTGKGGKEFIVPTGSTYEDVIARADTSLNLRKIKLFEWIAKKKNYDESVRPGRYIVNDGMTYVELVNMLRAGRQKPVNITFNNIRTLNQLAGKIGKKIEADSLDIISFLEDDSNYKTDGFNRETVIAVFIPNTYQVFWNTSAGDFYKRMLKEYRSFWNMQRISQAKEKGLDPIEVSIIASIVDDEVAKKDEKPRIAGVYLNRLKRGIPLQACPTIKFALNDFTITRVLKKHLLVDSPYNTYKHKGFPPGPVGCPSIEGIEAVLNAEQHDFIYFAAKADFSGYHNFSRTLSEHNRYAAMYQRELDRRKIFK